jgi:hypothetical protein
MERVDTGRNQVNCRRVSDADFVVLLAVTTNFQIAAACIDSEEPASQVERESIVSIAEYQDLHFGDLAGTALMLHRRERSKDDAMVNGTVPRHHCPGGFVTVNSGPIS